MRHPNGTGAQRGQAGTGAAEPAVAIVQGEQEVVVKIALGWVVHGSVRVSCTARTLVVEAERCAGGGDAPAPGPRGEGAALRCVVPLPCAVQAGEARARLARGELTVRMALPEARPS